MIRLFKWLIWGEAHTHKWEILKYEQCDVTYRDLLDGGSTTTVEDHYILQCNVCGKLKQYRA